MHCVSGKHLTLNGGTGLMHAFWVAGDQGMPERKACPLRGADNNFGIQLREVAASGLR